MLAATGPDRRHAAPWRSPPTRRAGRRDGHAGCKAIVAAYDRAIATGAPGHRAVALRRRPAARGRGLAARGRQVFAIMTRASGKIPQISVVLGAGGRRRGVRPGADRRRDPLRPRPDLRHRPRRRALGHRRGRRHGAARRSGAARPPQRRRPHVDRLRGRGARPARRLAVLLGKQDAGDRAGRRSTRRPRRRCCPSPPSAPTTCTRWSTGCSTSPGSSCTRAGPRTSSPRSAGSAAGPSASSPTTRCGSAAAWTRRPPRRPRGSCGCATRSACRWSWSSTCPGTCPASARSGTASCGAAPSCCTRSPRPSCRGSRW